MSDDYRRIAPWYDVLIDPFNRALRPIGFALFKPDRNAQVLEVGCGTGTQLAFYRDRGCRITGIDLSAAMLRAASGRLAGGTLVCQGDAARLPFPDRTFGLVLANLVLHEMDPARASDRGGGHAAGHPATGPDRYHRLPPAAPADAERCRGKPLHTDNRTCRRSTALYELSPVYRRRRHPRTGRPAWVADRSLPTGQRRQYRHLPFAPNAAREKDLKCKRPKASNDDFHSSVAGC